MKKAGIPENIYTYNALICACEKCDQLVEALWVLGESRNKNKKKNVTYYKTYLYNILHSIFIYKLRSFASQVWEHMKAVGVPGDAVTYRVLIRACEKGGEGQKVME
jgi:hypothetical protein